MKPSQALQGHQEQIRRIVAEHRASNPRLFGSVLHCEDHDGSDLDILVDGAEDLSLLDLAQMERRLGELLGVVVDVRTPLDLPARFRAQVLAEAKQL